MTRRDGSRAASSQAELFDDHPGTKPHAIAPGAILLPRHVDGAEVWAEVCAIAAAAPFRHMTTPGGKRMSVSMTNCGALGWVSDRRGYRYQPGDPESGQPWPAMPPTLAAIARDAAALAGFPGFAPDACLVNRYEPGSQLALHQDRDERDFGHPIVSISLGLPATFVLGGTSRAGPTASIPLAHEDVLVLGGESRMRHHGVRPIAEGTHALLGRCRINLTFRRAA